MAQREVHLLLVDDDEIDTEALQRALRKARIANSMTTVGDGLEALDALRGTGGRDPIPRPYLILLDLNMPRMNGQEFLDELRSDEDLQDSIVFVLTTSDADHDKMAAYSKNVAGYIVKHRAGEDFLKLIGMLDCYWKVVEFPPDTGVAH